MRPTLNMIKFIVLAIFCASTCAAKYNCTAKSALLIQKRPAYEFSVKLLDRVSQETDGHFVFSPISTYMQLLALAEGARGATAEEIWNVTRYHRLKCFRRKWKWIVNKMDVQLDRTLRRKSLIVVDKLVKVKKAFVRELKMLKSMEVLPLAFNEPETSAYIVNKIISDSTSGVIDDTISPYDFKYTALFTVDASYYQSDWKIPFNPAYTKPETFYTMLGNREVNMMNRIDYFNVADITAIKARVLELPCGRHGRVSMLVMLPYGYVGDVFFDLQRIRLMSIFNTFKLNSKKLVNVKIPRFKLKSDVDNIPELLFDMGVRRLFHPNSANLRGISGFKMCPSLMTQAAEIEVDEMGVRAGAVADFLVSNRTNAEDFTANRPFAYMLVDTKTEIILFAGIYSAPEMY